MRKPVNLKLEWMKNYDPKKKKITQSLWDSKNKLEQLELSTNISTNFFFFFYCRSQCESVIPCILHDEIRDGPR